MNYNPSSPDVFGTIDNFLLKISSARARPRSARVPKTPAFDWFVILYL